MIRKTLTKATVLASALTLLTTATHANAPKTGIYLGAALGGAAMTGKSNLFTNFVNGGLGQLTQNWNRGISDKNVASDIFIGFGKRFNCVWAGIEALASFTSLNNKDGLDITNEGSQDSLQTKTSNAWGGAINLGYYINAMSKLYLKLGVESRRFRVTFVNNTAGTPLPGFNKSYNSTAFVPGLGMETDLTPRFSLRAEYRAALHKGKSVQNIISQIQGSSVRTKPTIHYFNLGLTVKI